MVSKNKIERVMNLQNAFQNLLQQLVREALDPLSDEEDE